MRRPFQAPDLPSVGNTRPMHTFEIVAGDAVDAALLHAAFTHAFADYLIGPFQVPLAQWPQFVDRQGVELGSSRVAVSQGEPVAFCMVAPRPECGSWRLGFMGAVPAARGSGAAPALLDDFIARAEAAGMASVELECFAQNTRAVRLYRSRGFEAVDSLYGYQCTAPTGVPQAMTPAVVGVPEALDWLDACTETGCALPLQATARLLRAHAPRLQAWRLRSAQLVFSISADDTIHVHSLVDQDAGQDAATELVRALLANFPGRPIRAPQLQRQAVSGTALERAGFERLALHQLWMRRGPLCC